jgi:hypothetical protein
MMEAAWNIRFPEGSNDDLKLMGHLWEPLKVFHKPLVVHLASEGSVFVTHLALQVRFWCNWKRERWGGSTIIVPLSRAQSLGAPSIGSGARPAACH